MAFHKMLPLKDKSGQSNMEYILIIGVVLCALLFVITQYGGRIMGLFSSQSDKVADADIDLQSEVDAPAANASVPSSENLNQEAHQAVKMPRELPEPPSFFARWLPYVLLVLVFILMLAIIITKIKQRRILKQLKELDESGQAMTETALTLPIVLFFVFSIMQLGLLYHARFIVHLASYNAARSAIVWIPQDEGEGKNAVKISSNDEKFQRMLNAARITCIPIASSSYLDEGLSVNPNSPYYQAAQQFLQGPSQDFFNTIITPLNEVFQTLSDIIPVDEILKFGYAYMVTSVELMHEGTFEPYKVGEKATFSENGPITVRVNFYYKLNLPLVNAFLGEKIFPASIDDLGAGDIFADGGNSPISLSGWYFKIRSTTTLDNEGFKGFD